MKDISFADIVHQSIVFSADDPIERVLLQLIDTPWFQRLRDISQTADTRLVYMYSEHSRFGHCLGVSYLAKLLLQRLEHKSHQSVTRFRPAVLVAALLHDVGHLAPGSHSAFRAWFPGQPDSHEALTQRIIREDPVIQRILGSFSTELSDMVCAILQEDSGVPAWTWQAISGGGWNVDRGNWCIVDSLMAGVSYGKYNIPALTDAMVITPQGDLAISENRLDAMMHFAVSRHAMYRQLYQHRVILTIDTLNASVVQRARDLGNKLAFMDESMRDVLAAQDPSTLSLRSVFWMRESWWRYHLARWAISEDKVLSDLADRLLHRRLLKTVRVGDSDDYQGMWQQAQAAVSKAGFDPRYYLHRISTSDTHIGDRHQSMPVVMDDGSIKYLGQADPLFQALIQQTAESNRVWYAMPLEAKELLGRKR